MATTAKWGCGSSTNPGGVASVIATLNGDTLTISGEGAMENYATQRENVTPWRVVSSSCPWFNSRTSITTVVIEQGVTYIGKVAFSNCTALTSVTIGNSVTSIGESAFEKCTALTSITIPNSVTSIGNDAFGVCEGLTSITISNSVTSIGDRAFCFCPKITRIYANSDVPASVGNAAFIHVNKTACILHVPSGTQDAYKAAEQWKDFTNIVEREAAKEVAAQHKFDKNDAEAYYERGNTYLDKGYIDQAIADFTQAIELAPNYADAYSNRGFAYFNKDMSDPRAIADFTQGITLDPNSVERKRMFASLLYNRGLTYAQKSEIGNGDFDIGELDKAIADFKQAIAIDPNNAMEYKPMLVNTYSLRGLTYYSKNDYDRAIADFTQTLKLDPNNVTVRARKEEAERKAAEQRKKEAQHNYGQY